LTIGLNCSNIPCGGHNHLLLFCNLMPIKLAIQKYLNFCLAEGLCNNTIKDKSRHLGWLKTNKPIQELTLDDIYDFINKLEVSKIRKWRVKIDLRAFFRYLNMNGLSPLNYELIRNKEPEMGIRPDLLKEEFDRMTVECIKLIKANTPNKKKYIRWYYLHNFMWETGLRRSELCNIKEWDNSQRTFYIITAKTLKKRQGFFQTDLTKYLDLYKPQERLFGLAPREVDHMVFTLRTLSQLTRKITPHSYRHAYCTRLLTSGCPIQQTALLAGHQKVSTTMRYYHETNLKGAYEEFINPPRTLELRSKVGIKNKYSIKISVTKNK
jgi:site-specific recombinase XerD